MSMAHIILYADDFSYDVWEEYCEICGEDASAISLTISFDIYKNVKAVYEEDEEEEGHYEICVMNKETYRIEYAKSKEDAIIQAIDFFKDDDEFFGTEEAENVTEDDCEIVWYECC